MQDPAPCLCSIKSPVYVGSSCLPMQNPIACLSKAHGSKAVLVHNSTHTSPQSFLMTSPSRNLEMYQFMGIHIGIA